MRMSNEMKPVRCGCGGEAEIGKKYLMGNLPDVYVICGNCSIRTGEYYSEAEAIEAWNKAMGAKDINVPAKNATDTNVGDKDNLISRQEALDAIQKRADEIDSVYSAYWEGLKIAQDIVEKVPSAERRWIPVTEALPEEETTVLVTAHYDGDKYYRYKPNDYVTTAEYIGDRWCFADEEFIMQLHKHHVIAWMPLPEPWRGER